MYHIHLYTKKNSFSWKICLPAILILKFSSNRRFSAWKGKKKKISSSNALHPLHFYSLNTTSLLFFYISCDPDGENLFNNQEHLWLEIISFSRHSRLIQSWYCKENLGVCHLQAWKGLKVTSIQFLLVLPSLSHISRSWE